jgi:hypothetical protein
VSEPGPAPPFLAEPVIGWRAWGLRRRSRELELVALTDERGAWPARKELVAACHPYRGARLQVPVHGSAPVFGCSCGIYASDSLRSLALSAGAFPPVPVVGTAAMWGRVIEHDRGYRAEFAYPDRLRLVCARCAQEGRGTGVATAVLEQRTQPTGMAGLLPLCAEHLDAPAVRTSLLRDAQQVESELLGRYAVEQLPFERVQSLFERDPVPVPWERPAPVRPPALAPPTPACSPPRSSAPRATPPPAPPLARRLRHAGGKLLVWMFWAVCFWQYCASQVVQVPQVQVAAPSTSTASSGPIQRPVLTSIAGGPAKARPRHAQQHKAVPLGDLAFVCGVPHGDRVELAGCGRKGADLMGMAEERPAGPCADMTKAVTKTDRYRICWWWFGYEDVGPHPTASNPFAKPT